jgi:hypothetical protein
LRLTTLNGCTCICIMALNGSQRLWSADNSLTHSTHPTLRPPTHPTLHSPTHPTPPSAHQLTPPSTHPLTPPSTLPILHPPLTTGECAYVTRQQEARQEPLDPEGIAYSVSTVLPLLIKNLSIRKITLDNSVSRVAAALVEAQQAVNDDTSKVCYSLHLLPPLTPSTYLTTIPPKVPNNKTHHPPHPPSSPHPSLPSPSPLHQHQHTHLTTLLNSTHTLQPTPPR